MAGALGSGKGRSGFKITERLPPLAAGKYPLPSPIPPRQCDNLFTNGLRHFARAQRSNLLASH